MADRVEQVKTVSTEPAPTAGTTQTVVERRREPGSFTAARIVWFVAGVLITFLALRFVFVLLGANQGNGFVDFIYAVSHPFVSPFFGIFNYDFGYGVSRVEVSALIAIAIYALVAWGIARLLTIRHPEQP
jgi:uncharacterized protein YggT (Ycf19 family)